MKDIIDESLTLISNSDCNHLNPHLIFCVSWFYNVQIGDVFLGIILEKMKEYDIKSSLVTLLEMTRIHLITKGMVESKDIGIFRAE